MAKPKVSLPASYGGIMRYDTGISDVKISPGYVVLLTLLVVFGLLFMRLLD
ncbi:MAG: hypothetical protein GOU99_03235 [Candidatus Altiarchaeota archaeon]|nr:hypothetical protein [Candidatus Altiarchaeota archaeon]